MFLRTRILLSVLCCTSLASSSLAGTIYVSSSARGDNNGGTWADAFTSLSAAINRAECGDEVWVSAGTYQPIELKQGVKVYGGFAGVEATAASSDPETYKTYIDGGGQQRAVMSVDNDASTVLRGFYIVNGRAPDPVGAGGGLYLDNSSAVFVHCVFVSNIAEFAGGAAANYHGGSPKFINCRFESNGGGTDRSLTRGGGAFFNHQTGSAPEFVNCLFTGNKAYEGGAVITLAHAVSFVNCTFAGNVSTKGKGHALFDNRGDAVLRNCILWNGPPTDESSGEIHNDPTIASTNVTHSDVRGGWQGEGNIDADPMFIDAAAKDFRLQERSPCRDGGENAQLPADSGDLDLNGDVSGSIPKDLNMRARVYGNAVDMGAYEWALP